jgi:hypothetical protein
MKITGKHHQNIKVNLEERQWENMTQGHEPSGALLGVGKPEAICERNEL